MRKSNSKSNLGPPDDAPEPSGGASRNESDSTAAPASGRQKSAGSIPLEKPTLVIPHKPVAGSRKDVIASGSPLISPDDAEHAPTVVTSIVEPTTMTGTMSALDAHDREAALDNPPDGASSDAGILIGNPPANGQSAELAASPHEETSDAKVAEVLASSPPEKTLGTATERVRMRGRLESANSGSGPGGAGGAGAGMGSGTHSSLGIVMAQAAENLVAHAAESRPHGTHGGSGQPPRAGAVPLPRPMPFTPHSGPHPGGAAGAGAAHGAHSWSHRHLPDAPLRTMIGLVIVWVSLVIVFRANSLSDTGIKIRVSDAETIALDSPIIRAMEPRNTLLLPFDMYIQASRREALLNLAHQIGFSLDPEQLRRMDVSDDPTTIRVPKRTPLYQAIHGLLGNTDRGFALTDRTLIVFPQVLTVKSSDAGTSRAQSLDWKAQLHVGHQPVLIVPSAGSDVWFSVHLNADASDPGGELNIVQLEVWKGGDWLTAVRGRLDEHGAAQLNLTTVGRVTFSIQRMAADPKDSTPQFQMEFYYQAFD